METGKTGEKIEIIDEYSLKVNGEDHTMMNVLRWAIASNWVGDNVEFCGYTIPHPSEKAAHLNVQFENKSLQTPRNVLKKAYEGLECVEAIATRVLDMLNEAEDSM